jgi:glycopeptide antibiotics resistance protein
MSAVVWHMESMGGVMLLALPLWLLLRTLWLLHKQQSPRWGRELLLVFFVLYLIGLASQTLTIPPSLFSDPQAIIVRAMQRWETGHGISLTPGYTIRSMLEKGSYGQKVINLAGNVLIFVPLGFLPPLLWKRWRHLWAAVPLSAGVSCLIEFLQLFLGRSVDVDDLILNTLGGLMGYLLFCLLPKKRKR